MRALLMIALGLAVIALGLAVIAPAALAEDPPTFSVETLAPQADDLQDGWTFGSGSAPADQPTADAIMEIAKSVGLGDLEVYAEVRRLTAPEGPTIDVAYIDIDADPGTFRKALDEVAAAKGWAVREASTPYRLLVVGGAGGAQEAAIRHQLEHLVRRFVGMAETRLIATTRHEDDRLAAEAAARSFLERGKSLGVDAAALDTLEAFLHWRVWAAADGKVKAAEAKLKKTPDDEKSKQALEENKPIREKEKAAYIELAKKAFAPGRRVPATGWLPVSVAGRSGGMLLEKKDKALLPEAVQLLEAAVEAEMRSPNANLAYENRYNLACGYALQNRIDDAFDMLEKSLEAGASQPPFQFGPSFLHMRDKDPDMGVLRKDPRWDPLIEKYYTDKLKKWEEAQKKKKDKDKGNNPHGDDPNDEGSTDEEGGSEDEDEE
ncbi:MAG: hypothetical protein AB7T63_08950 [Planctomycetota bacterium]